MDKEKDKEPERKPRVQDFTRSALERMLEEYLSRESEEKRKRAAQEKEEKERESLVDLKEEKNGASPKIPVTKDDLPGDLESDEGDLVSALTAEKASSRKESPSKKKA
jgi:hypothetical protein